MATNYSTYGDISAESGGKAKRRLLKRGQHQMLIERVITIDPLQKHSTKTARWRRYHSLPRASAPLAEGVPPTGHKMTFTDVTATMEEYGDIVELTNWVEHMHPDDVISEYVDICGDQAAETIEEVRINVAKAGTNVFYAGGTVTTRGTVTAPISRGDFRRVERHFNRYKAKKYTRLMKASHKISTEPIDAAFLAFGHTDLAADIRGCAGFIPVQNYADSDKRLPGEVGTVESHRVCLSAMFEPWETSGASGTDYLSGGVLVSGAASCDVYPLLCFAKDSFGGVPLAGFEAVDIGVQRPGKKSKSDPMGRMGSISWISFQTAAILNQNWMARIEVAATANPS